MTREGDHVLRHPAYRALLTGHTVNYLGNGIAPVALAFAVLDLGGDATDLGLVVGLYALADVAAVLFGGVLGDRVSRRMMMQGCSAAAAIVQGVAAVALIGGWSSLPFLAATGMLIGALGALGSPSSSAITQQTVPAGLLQQAISWRRLGQNIAMIVGAGLAGLMVASAGSGWALAVDAATFAVAA
ncbi:MAG TPA: MFS transporter, partial [Nocardioides sp.]|nr:MFS transporter [Nocardioides sp.]